MSRDQEMLAWLHETFQLSRPVAQCIESSTDDEMVVCEKGGDGSPCAFHKTERDGFYIKNSRQKEIHLLATDQCFFTVTDEKRCDCIVFDDDYYCFVELKLSVKPRNFGDNAKEARKQLGNTIRFFEETSKADFQIFLEFKREAYVVMRDHVYPRNIAARKEAHIRFLQEYKVPLFEQNKKEF